tara:strand:+ start:3852 stop:4382 length:531 start_codon:yes stop_codon:yes gene_type:complete
MKESRKELILELHSETFPSFKLKIEKEFPKLFKKDDLVVGEWYKYPDFENWKLLITDNTKGKEKGVGFSCSGIWMEDWLTIGGFELDRLIPCLDKEVKQALIKEAKKRGFKGGVCFTPTNGDIVRKTDLNERWGFTNECKLLLNNYSVFDNGKWATIVETITKEEAEKELGKTIID